MMASRGITAGEELFMPYQDYYWLSELYHKVKLLL
jgi:hypothetical protein